MILLIPILITLFFGMWAGGLATTLIYRLPQLKKQNIIPEEVYITPFCDHCKHELKVIDYIPIFSFIRDGKRCRYCSTQIENRLLYFLIELSCSIFFVTSFLLARDNITLYVLSSLTFPLLQVIAGISILTQDDKNTDNSEILHHILYSLLAFSLTKTTINHPDIFIVITISIFSLLVSLILKKIILDIIKRYFNHLYDGDLLKQSTTYKLLFTSMVIWTGIQVELLLPLFLILIVSIPVILTILDYNQVNKNRIYITNAVLNMSICLTWTVLMILEMTH